MKKFQIVSKYRHSIGTVAKKEDWYSDLQVSTSSLSDSSYSIKASEKWVAVNWGMSGGTLGILRLDHPGKLGVASKPLLLHAHAAHLVDWDFSEFDNDLIATGGEDNLAKVWRIPSDGLEDSTNPPAPLITLSSHSRRVESVKFHTTASNLVTTISAKYLHIHDIVQEASEPAITLTHEDQVHSLAWSPEGDKVGTTCRDALVRVWDPRAGNKAIAEGKGHEGIKASRMVWVGAERLFTTGFSKMRDREYALWDMRDLSKPLKKTRFDTSTGVLMPLYDADTNIMYICGKGDSRIHVIEISDSPSNLLTDIAPCGTNISQSGVTMVPKRSLNVMNTEIARILLLTTNAIVPVSFNVPRKQYLDFHADLFPDTKSNVPALTSIEWLQGETRSVQRISLDPTKRDSQKVVSDSVVSTLAGSTSDVLTPKSTLVTSVSSVPSAATTATSLESRFQSLSAVDSKPSIPSTGTSATQDSRQLTESKPPINEITSAPSAKAIAAQSRFAPGRASLYRYIAGVPYHPSQHFDDLRDLDVSKGGDFDPIQANRRFIAIPLSGPGGRIGIINTDKPGRLPIKIPAVMGGSSVVDFKFDPFEINRLVTACDSNKIRIWRIPENGLVEDMVEPEGLLVSPKMDKISVIQFHPTAKDVLLSASLDNGNSTLRVWDIIAREEKIVLDEHHHDVIFNAIWSHDGQHVATSSRDKKIRIFDVRKKELIAEFQSHSSARPSRLIWLGETNRIASVGFGSGSQREILLFDIAKFKDGPIDKKVINISPSTMSPYYDIDCQILYLAGRGDMNIYCYEILAPSQDGKNTIIYELPKIESTSLQQGFAFLPKKYCDVKKVEIAKFYRLTPKSVETYGVTVPRSRIEFFQDDIFRPTYDVETAGIQAEEWFEGKNEPLKKISLVPEGMILLSDAPPIVQTIRKVELGKKEMSPDETKQQFVDNMISRAKDLNEREVLPQDAMEGVDASEWDD